jgi:glutamyl-tRNA reductase
MPRTPWQPSHSPACPATERDRLSTLASELLISELRQRGEAAAAQVLLRNRTALAKLSADDRRRVELLIRAVVARLLEEPESHLQRVGPDDASGPRLEAVRELFELDGRTVLDGF